MVSICILLLHTALPRHGMMRPVRGLVLVLLVGAALAVVDAGKKKRKKKSGKETGAKQLSRATERYGDGHSAHCTAAIKGRY